MRFHWPVASPADAETSWLRVSTPYSGNGKGQLFVPETGSQVLVGYEQGRAEAPVVLGNLFHDQNPQQATYTRPDNNLKGMQTAGGNKFVMQEVADGQSILLSNSNKETTSILLSFSDQGQITIQSEGPITLVSGDTITLEAAKNIELRAGEDISNAAQKNVSVAAREETVTVQAQKDASLTAMSGDLTLEAASKKVITRAVDSIEITASGVVKVRGQDVKLNNPG